MAGKKNDDAEVKVVIRKKGPDKSETDWQSRYNQMRAEFINQLDETALAVFDSRYPEWVDEKPVTYLKVEKIVEGAAQAAFDQAQKLGLVDIEIMVKGRKGQRGKREK